jgi:hypothetical protein
VNRLRVGIRLQECSPPAWVTRAIRKIEQHVDLCALVAVDARRPPRPASLYARLDRRILGSSFSPLATDASFSFTCPTTLRPEQALAVLRDHDPDLVIDFCTDQGSVLPACGPLGTWYVRLGALGTSDRQDREHTFEVSIVARSSDREHILERSISAVDPVSLARTLDPALWKSASMLGRCVLRAADTRQIIPCADRESPEPMPEIGVSTLVPTAIRTAEVVARVLHRRVRKAFWRDEWFLGAERTERPLVSHGHKFVALPQPSSVYRADPFLFEREGRTYLFFEEFPYRVGRGHICVGLLDEAMQLTDVRMCLTRNYHLSYPCVFESESSTYMLPETAANGQIELYRASAFPDQWELWRVLVPDIIAVDPTIHFDGVTWWLFAGVVEAGASADDELFLWYADRLDGDWTAHPRNPIVSDVRAARPAGRLFSDQGVLVRPAQDGSRGYGSAMNLRRVLTLTRDEYAEAPFARLSPAGFPGAHSTHTINSSSGLAVTDGELRRPRGEWTQWLKVR